MEGTKFQVDNKTRKPREANFVNITDSTLKNELKELVTLPDKDLHLNYVIWYKKDDPSNWGLTIKGFPDKTWGTQHVYKVTWTAEKNVDGGFSRLMPARHCEKQTSEISGDGFLKVVEFYNKHKKN